MALPASNLCTLLRSLSSLDLSNCIWFTLIYLDSIMSLQVNLSSREINQAYQDVVNANGIDWMILTYEKGSNDLKIQSTGDGGLEKLEDEFSDGRYGGV